ncbi:MAG: hypothetical protein HDT30_06425 [Clostridiales bacterium]|nr:hypothetical protein [Clostridiales bacterium]
MFYDWLSMLAKLENNDDSTRNAICPECGERSIKFVYVGDRKSSIGYLPAWCESWNKGIIISRVEIPQGVRMIDGKDLENIKKEIPNFIHVAPDSKETR